MQKTKNLTQSPANNNFNIKYDTNIRNATNWKQIINDVMILSFFFSFYFFLIFVQ